MAIATRTASSANLSPQKETGMYCATVPEENCICPAGFLCGCPAGVGFAAGLHERSGSRQRHFLQSTL